MYHTQYSNKMRITFVSDAGLFVTTIDKADYYDATAEMSKRGIRIVSVHSV